MLGNLEEASLFLETAVLNLEILSLMPEFQAPPVKNHIIYLEGLLRMQLCALFSQLHRHREGLYHSQISVRISHYLIRDTFNYSDAMKVRDILESMDQKEDGKDENNSLTFLSILQRNYISIQPVLKEVYKCLVKEENGIDQLESRAERYVSTDEAKATMDQKYKDRDPNDIDMKNLLGFMNQNLYHDYMNITNIMKLKRLDFRDVYGNRSPDLILTRENLVERFILLVASYFCIGTELRFLKQMNTEGFKDTQDAEFWHGKAVELAVNFLPSNAPLVKHIVSSYSKHHSPCNDKIPEDQEVREDVHIFKAQKGVMSNKLAPMIKKVEKTTIRLTPLDIPHNDYLADIFEDREEIPNDKNLGASNSAKNIDENNNDTNNEYNDNYLSIKQEKTAETAKEKRSRPLTSKGKRKFIRNKNTADGSASNDAITASLENKDSEEEGYARPLTISDGQKGRKRRKASQEKPAQFDNKSTTIIIHDKDVTTDNLHISVYKKRKDRASNPDVGDGQLRKFSGRGQKETKSSERIGDKFYSHTDSRGNSRRRRARTKKHHTGSDILLKESNHRYHKDRNVSVEISKNKSIAELQKNGNQQKTVNIKKKSIQYSMKRSRINDLLKNNLSIEGGGYLNEKNIKLAITKELRKSNGYKRFKDFRHSSSSIPSSVNLSSSLNTRNKKQSLYPYENHTSSKEKRGKNNLRYDSFKRKYTVFNEGVKGAGGRKLSNNFMRPNAKMSQSLDREA